MRSITPVVAVVVLLLMTVSAAGMAFLTITSYQSQAQSGSESGIERIGVSTRTQLKIESVSGGQIYLRNLGSETFSNPSFYVEGKPLNFTGPSECEPGKLCVYTVLENVTCSGDCELSMGEDMPVGTSVSVSEEDLGTVGLPECGDASCDAGEDCGSCSADCSCTYECCVDTCCSVGTYCSGSSCTSCDNSCDGTCQGSGCTSDNDCTSTPCCGNGVCDGSETVSTCPQDCPLTLSWPSYRHDSNNSAYSPEVTSPSQSGVFEVRNFTDISLLGYFASTPLVGDLDGDGQQDIVVYSSEALFAFYGVNDSIMWQNSSLFADGNHVFSITNVDEDSVAEILLFDQPSESIYSVYGNNGTAIWSYQKTELWPRSNPVVFDIDNDGVLDVVFPSKYALNDNSTIIALRGDTGALKWEYEVKEGTTYYYAFSNPAIADIDNDGIVEIIFGSDKDTVEVLYGSNGTQKWSYNTTDNIRSSPSLADLDDDGNLEIIIGSYSNSVYALYSNGTLMWSYDCGDDVGDVAVADINGDGDPDVVFMYGDNSLSALYGINGTLMWDYQDSDVRNWSGIYYMSSAVIGDADGDGSNDVIYSKVDLSDCATAMILYGVNGTNQANETFVCDLFYSVAAPSLADIDGDGVIEISFSASDQPPV